MATAMTTPISQPARLDRGGGGGSNGSSRSSSTSFKLNMMSVYARASTLQARQQYDTQPQWVIVIMKALRLITCVAVLGCVGCGGNAGPSFDKADQDQIRKVIADLRTAFNAKDPAKAAALYSSNAAVMPPNRSLMR